MRLFTFSVFLFFISGFIFSQTTGVDTLPFTTNGPVYAMHKKGNRYFIGGSFTQAGTRNEFMSKLALNERYYQTFNPLSDGPVYNACSDNSGGYFVLGGFTFVGDSTRIELAQFGANNKTTAFAAKSYTFGTNITYATKMVAWNNYLFVCGQINNGIISFNTLTGQALPNLIYTYGGQSVMDMELKNNKLYLCGYFDSINSTFRKGFAVIDLPTMTVDPYMPADLNTQTSFQYENIEIADDSTLILAGNFSYTDPFFNYYNYNLIEFSLNNGDVKPRLMNYNEPNFMYYHKMKLIGNDTLLLARDSLIEIFALGTSTVSVLTTLNTHTITGFFAAEKANNCIYIGGEFKKINNLPVNGLFKIPLGTITPTTIPYIQGFSKAYYYSIIKGNNHLFLGGDYIEHGLQTSTGFVCYDDNIKEIVYNPSVTDYLLNGPPYIRKIKEYKGKLYVIGKFRDINLQFKPGFFNIDVNSFAMQSSPSFNTGPCNFDNKNIYDVQFFGNWMNLYGYFPDINGVTKYNYAKVNLVTNSVTPSNFLCGNNYNDIELFNPLVIWKNDFYIFPNFNYVTLGTPTCGPLIKKVDTASFNCIDICGIDTTKYSYIEEARLRGNKIYCIETEINPVNNKAYTYDLMTNTYSPVYFNAVFQWRHTSNHSVFYKNYWVIGCLPSTVNSLPSNKTLLFMDTLTNALTSFTFNPANFTTGLFSNDTTLMSASFPGLMQVFKTASPSII